MLDFGQLEVPIFIISLFSNIALAVVVYKYASEKTLKSTFTAFVVAQVLWISANFLAFQTRGEYFLWSIRLIYFFAIFHSALFFIFVRMFLKPVDAYVKKTSWLILTAATIIAIFTLSPLVISGTALNLKGEEVPTNGWGFLVWVLSVNLFIFFGFVRIVFKFFSSKGVEKKQWQFLMLGLASTFGLVLIFSFINPVFFGDISTARLTHVYTFPFVLFTAYAIVKYRLLSLKTVLAELAVIFLNFFLLIKVLTSATYDQLLVNLFIFLGVLLMSRLVIEGVYREIHHAKELEYLTEKLEAANAQLMQLDEARADFIFIASHQLRTPPTTIKWYLAAIQNGDYGSMESSTKEAVTKAELANNSQINLIDDLLNASRIERGKMEFLFEEVDLNDLAISAFEQLVPQAKFKNLEMVLSKSSGSSFKIVADKEKIRQVINNLIDNAIKYTKEGSIEVNVGLSGADAVVRVKDSGIGLSVDKLPYLFDKYTRGKDSVMHATGLGLGLYVARVIVRQHNGKIWAESQGEGKGSTFVFTIPLKGLIEPNTTSILDLSKIRKD